MKFKSIGAALALTLLAMSSAHAFGQSYHQPNDGVTFSFSIGSNGSQSAGIQFNSPAQYGSYGNHGTYGNYENHGSYRNQGNSARYPYGYVDPYERRAMQLRETRDYRRQQIRQQRQLERRYDREPQYRNGTWIFVSP